MLEYFKLAAQITIAISIYNVWFLRFNKSTIYRGKDAKNMKDEFISYGLKGPFVWIIGFLKVTLFLSFQYGCLLLFIWTVFEVTLMFGPLKVLCWLLRLIIMQSSPPPRIL